MERVATALAQRAVAAPTHDEADVFGRSSFNRYYYATYLITRAFLKSLDASWARISHADIPPLLEGEVLERTRSAARAAEEGGLMTHHEAATLRSSVQTAASGLASMMRGAREVRRVADYEPENQILRNGSVIRLVDHSIGEARNWPRRADACAGIILKAWRRFGLI